MTRYGLTLTTLTALATALVAHAQTSQTAGAIRGTVVSKAGKAVQGAVVVLRNRETGFTRRATTDPKGSFLYSLVPVGTYDLNVSADGMQASSAKNVQVSLGEAAAIQFKLAEASVATEVVDVVAAPAGIDATQVSASASIRQELFDAIPVSGRNFTDLVQMTPGAAVNSQGYRTSVEGARGTMNNLQIDGASFNSKFVTEQRGGTRVPFSFGMDTIRELQVITNAYDAQYGDAAGAIINAITKGGSNEVAGSAMILTRPESMVANVRTVPYDRLGTINPIKVRERHFSQTQANFNIGGPLIKDKLFYFVGVEAYRYKQDNTPAMSTGSSGVGNAPTDYSAFMGGLGNRLIVHPDGATVAQEATMPWTNDITNMAVFARLDWTINQDHRMYFRVNSQNYSGENNVNSQQRVDNRSRSNNSSNTFRTLSMVAELSSVLTPNLVNEARIQVSDEQRPFTPNSTVSSEFTLGGVSFGNYYIDPRKTNEQIVQFVDNMSLFVGDWTFKGGVNYQSTQMQNRYLPNGNGGWSVGSYGWANQWALGAAGAYTSTAVGSGQLRYSQSVSPLDGTLDFGAKSLSGYVNVQYQGLLDKRLMLSLGLRYTKETWDKNPNPNPKLAGLDQMPDASTVDPRLGFSLDVFGNAKTVVRGGYGHFTIGNAGQTVSGGVMNNGINLIAYSVYATSSTSSSNLPYQNLFKTGILSYANRVQNGSLKPLTAAEIAGSSLFSSSVVVTPLDPEAKMSQARRMSLGVEQMLPNGFKFGFTAKYAKFYNMAYAININLRQKMYDGTGKLVDDPNGFYNDGYPTNVNFFNNTNTVRPGKAIVRGRLLDLTGYGDVFLGRYDGKGDYRAALIELSRHQEKSFGFNLALTFAKSRDNNSNEVGTLNNNFSQPFDLTNPSGDLAPSDNDIRFRGVLSVYTPPIYGFKLSGMVQYQTGRPYTGRYSSDLNGDGNNVNDPAPGFGGRNNFRQPNARWFDMRISRPFQVTKKFRLEGIIDVYNVFNWANWTTSNYTAASSSAPYADFGWLSNTDSRTREVQFTLKARF